MPRSHVQGLAEESDMPELPRILSREGVGQDGAMVRSAGRAEAPRGASRVFTREDFLDMQNDQDLAPSLAGDDEDGFIQIRSPGKGYFTMHPEKEYELYGAVTYDQRKSDSKVDPYLVLRPMWGKFPPAVLRIKRFVLCMGYVDGMQRSFVWMADWYERGEAPSDFHKSIARVFVKARQGWGQALFDANARIYRWYHWSEGMGEEPVAVWPLKDFYTVLSETLHDRVIKTADHELIQCQGEERP
jgi:hypothetical protein